MKKNQINNEELHPNEWAYWQDLPEGYKECQHVWRDVEEESLQECIYCGLERDLTQAPNKFIYFR